MKNPYPTYKPTTLPWLPEVPEHWSLARYKYLFKEVNERSENGDEDLLSVSQYTGVTFRKDSMEDERDNLTNASSLEGYKIVRQNDLVINIMLAWNGSLGISPYDGIVSPAYCIYKGLPRVHPAYFHYLLRTDYSKVDFKKVSTGVVDSRLRMYTDDFFSLYTILPPLPEQRQIAAFLDHKCGLIDTCIQKKTRLIELLKEQKQAIINKAVTQGVKSDTSFDSFNNEWYPSLPHGWKPLKLKRVITRAVDGPHFSPEYFETGIPFLSARNIKVEEWSLEDAKYISEEDYEDFSKRIRPEIGDVLYTKGGTTGVARAVDLPFRFQVWVHIAVLKLNRKIINPEFLATVLNSTICYEQSQLFTRGATNQDLGLGRMKEIVLPVPNSLLEQEAVVAHIQQETNKISLAISRIEREIELMQEYKTTLIAEAVTGRIDVREWQPRSSQQTLAAHATH